MEMQKRYRYQVPFYHLSHHLSSSWAASTFDIHIQSLSHCVTLSFIYITSTYVSFSLSAWNTGFDFVMEKRLSVNFLLGDAFLTLLLLHCIDEMMWLRFWECWAEKKKWKWSLVLIFSRSLGWWWFGSYDMTVWTTKCKAHKFCRLSCCSESWLVSVDFCFIFLSVELSCKLHL